VLSDIHGNLPALQAVLADVEEAGADIVVFGGDVAAGPMPVETRDRSYEEDVARRNFPEKNARFGSQSMHSGADQLARRRSRP
jgi:Icc-related predicted phosphoesterase